MQVSSLTLTLPLITPVWSISKFCEFFLQIVVQVHLCWSISSHVLVQASLSFPWLKTVTFLRGFWSPFSLWCSASTHNWDSLLKTLVWFSTFLLRVATRIQCKSLTITSKTIFMIWFLPNLYLRFIQFLSPHNLIFLQHTNLCCFGAFCTSYCAWSVSCLAFKCYLSFHQICGIRATTLERSSLTNLSKEAPFQLYGIV